MLQIWRRSRQRARHGGIERPAHQGQQKDGGNPGADLEAPVADVLMRHPIAGQVQHEAERKRRAPRPDQCATNGACCNVEGDDHSIRVRLELPPIKG